MHPFSVNRSHGQNGVGLRGFGRIGPVSGIANVVSIECDGFIRWNRLMNREYSIFTAFIFVQESRVTLLTWSL